VDHLDARLSAYAALDPAVLAPAGGNRLPLLPVRLVRR
jgi:hypothetical protein